MISRVQQSSWTYDKNSVPGYTPQRNSQNTSMQYQGSIEIVIVLCDGIKGNMSYVSLKWIDNNVVELVDHQQVIGSNAYM